jgi:hypothetical protein
MTRLIPAVGSKKLFTITYATPRESLESTPITLPTTEPTDPQITWTVQNSDLPVFSIKPFSVKYVACVYGAGKFVTAGTLSWRMVKNGASVATGTASVAANTFYTVNAWFLDVLPGDVLGLKLWSSVSDSNWDYKALFCYPTRLFPLPLFNYKQILKDVTWSFSSSLYPTLTLGNPSRAIASLSYCTFVQGENVNNYVFHYSGDYVKTMKFCSPHQDFGILRVFYYGDFNNPNTAGVNTSATYRPYYYCSYLDWTVRFRPLRIE